MKARNKYAVWGAVGITSLVAADALLRYAKRRQGSEYRFGASFSAQYARDLGLPWHETLEAMLDDLGVRHLRLMSHWNQIEKQPGVYDFGELDWQMDEAAKRFATVSLCVGIRQPHYPECHEPEWVKLLDKHKRNESLLRFIRTVVERYRYHPALVSWQLENEAWNRNRTFGAACEYDRKRIKQEFSLVKTLDPKHPIIMTLADAYGLPLGKPRPDKWGTSLYMRMHHGHGYIDSAIPAWWYRLRAATIERYLKRPMFIHELQCEPWGPGGTQTLSITEQNKSMTAERMLRHVAFAKETGMREIDLWGAEWWYWRKSVGDESLLEAARSVFTGKA
jgi:hypothetical protein